jgi:hypothetical protein
MSLVTIGPLQLWEVSGEESRGSAVLHH